jgi:hypothetical protein
LIARERLAPDDPPLGGVDEDDDDKDEELDVGAEDVDEEVRDAVDGADDEEWVAAELDREVPP